MFNGPVRSAVTTAIEQCFGPEIASYARHKHQGGVSGQKGMTYESLFLSFKAAQLILEELGEPGEDSAYLRTQIEGFVDDVCVSRRFETHYFQLKNSASLSWSGGDHSLEDDFCLQFELSCYLGEPAPAMWLVVPTAGAAAYMRQRIPSPIADFSGVFEFPYCEGSLNRLVHEFAQAVEVLTKLSKVSVPAPDQLEALLGTISVALTDFPNGCSIRELIEAVQRIFPSQLRVLDEHLIPPLMGDFKEILSKIPGLGYHVQRGFFSWSAMGTSGVFGFDCADERFIQFQNYIMQQRPSTFERFEELLPS